MDSSTVFSKAQVFFDIQNAGLPENSGLSPWSLQEIFLELQNSQAQEFEWRSPVSGFVLFRQQLDDVEIMHLAVREKGKGLGSSLLRDFFQFLKHSRRTPLKVFLEVSEKNIPAIQCYKKAGFALLGSRKNYYRNGDTALNMSYLLSNEPNERG